MQVLFELWAAQEQLASAAKLRQMTPNRPLNPGRNACVYPRAQLGSHFPFEPAEYEIGKAP